MGGYMWRVRLSSFAAGVASASVAGFFFLYKDHLLSRAVVSRQEQEERWVEDTREALEKGYEALNQRISALESRKQVGATTKPLE